jgi:4a-hydroxytetrahydrobiopterin dehydratase
MGVLSDSEVRQRLSALPDWRASDESAIVRDFAFANFAQAIVFVNSVAAAAELANHHPDILVHGWKNVRLTLSTHSQGGLTDADFELAAQLDRLA